ncbi:MAG: hypothetical protein ACK5JL_04730 [Candidatus Kapaibacterium sp.]
MNKCSETMTVVGADNTIPTMNDELLLTAQVTVESTRACEFPGRMIGL